MKAVRIVTAVRIDPMLIVKYLIPFFLKKKIKTLGVWTLVKKNCLSVCHRFEMKLVRFVPRDGTLFIVGILNARCQHLSKQRWRLP